MYYVKIMRYTSMFMTKSRFYSDHSFAHIVQCIHTVSAYLRKRVMK